MADNAPTIPAPRAIAPRPDALRVRGLLDGLAHELVRLVRRYGGSPAAARRALEIAAQLRQLGAELELPEADLIGADLLRDGKGAGHGE